MLLLTTPPLSPPSRAATPRSPHRGRQVRSLRSDEKCETRVVCDLSISIGASARSDQGAVNATADGGGPGWSRGGQAAAHAPVHALCPPESAANRYSVRPCESTI